MNTDEAIAFARRKAAGVIMDEDDALLRDWITHATKTEYIKFSDAMIRDFCKEDYSSPETRSPKEIQDGLKAILNAKTNRHAPVVTFKTKKDLLRIAAMLIVCVAGVVCWLALRHSSPAEIPEFLAINPDTAAVPSTLVVGDGPVISMEIAGVQTSPETVFIEASFPDSIKSYTKVIGPGERRNLASIYYSISTPPGKRCHVKLPGGTQVWLNADSHLFCSSAGAPGTRTIELEGEGYFEVYKNADHPFVVKAGNTDVQVLGTRFNINCYRNEKPVRVTLLDGAVNIGFNRATKMLKPGEQAITGDSGFTLVGADTSAVTAWKNGYFKFNQVTLPEIMRELERWYHVKVLYDKPPGDTLYTLTASRKLELSYILQLLSMGGIEAELRGNILMIKK